MSLLLHIARSLIGHAGSSPQTTSVPANAITSNSSSTELISNATSDYITGNV